MIKKFLLLFLLFVFNVSGDISNYDDDDSDLDSEFNDIFDDFYDSLYGYNYKASENFNIGVSDEQPTFSARYGAWMCGDCSHIDESKLLYGESLELESNGNFKGYVETQIGFTLNNMRCISIQTDARNTIRRVSGSCVGDEVILSVLSAFNTNIRIYG